MQDLIEGVAHFRKDVFPAKAELFAHLATHHTPHTLFIGCSDARVVPELITGTDPGDLFVIRTAGNLVPAYTPEADGVAASIEYAVAVLGVRDIVVCGHSACGAMTAIARSHDLSAAPAVAAWLRYADAPGPAPPPPVTSEPSSARTSAHNSPTWPPTRPWLARWRRRKSPSTGGFSTSRPARSRMCPPETVHPEK